MKTNGGVEIVEIVIEILIREYIHVCIKNFSILLLVVVVHDRQMFSEYKSGNKNPKVAISIEDVIIE